MAGQANTVTPIMLTPAWQEEQRSWLQKVRDGGRLEEVPPPHRTDKVCYYAFMIGTKQHRSRLPGPDDHAESMLEFWLADILPHIPPKVLLMGFLTGNVGHQIAHETAAKELVREKQRDALAYQMRHAKRPRN